MKLFFYILFFPFAMFGHFTWKWWERQWDGNIVQKLVHVLLWPVYGILYLILNFTHA
jgi:hypothetical protein